MKKIKKAFTLIEVIIATFVVTTLFAGVYSAINLMIKDLKKNQNNLETLNLATNWIDRALIYYKDYSITNPTDSWIKFVQNTWTWFFVFSWSSLIKKTQANYNSWYSFWEWPLDAFGDKSISSWWTQYYRILKISDYEVINSWTTTKTIFDNLLESEKNYISYPILEKIIKNNNNVIQLVYSTWFNIFNNWYFYTWSSCTEVDCWKLWNDYITFNSPINQTWTDVSFFNPWKATIWKYFIRDNWLVLTWWVVWNVTFNNNIITITSTWIASSTRYFLNPTYHIKFYKTWFNFTPYAWANHKLFYDLESDKTWWKWAGFTSTWVSSIYRISSKVVAVEWWNIIWEEIVESYLSE